FKGRTAAKARTRANGAFRISARTQARSWQKAYAWVEHDCDKKNRRRCDIMSYIPIPSKFKDEIYKLNIFELSEHVYYNSCDDTDN
ncbi:hypothetical protein OSTOST_06050, partial [Ostertagia ostertagi]